MAVSAQPLSLLLFEGNSLIILFLRPETRSQVFNIAPNAQHQRLQARYHPSSMFSSEVLANPLLRILKSGALKIPKILHILKKEQLFQLKYEGIK